MSTYTVIKAPDWWEGSTVDVLTSTEKYAYEHQVVCCKKYGHTCIPRGYVVHHINGNPKDNRVENLEFLTLSEHFSLHQKGNCNAAGNTGRLGQPHSEETKQKMREAALKRYRKS